MLATDTHKQILIVDRDVATAEALRQKLAEAGFAVRSTSDVAAAVSAVAERPPNLVIVDWNMPGFVGLELINGIRSRRGTPTVRLIILSSLTSEQDVVAGLNFGADDYIGKPFSVREVVARVSSVLRLRHRETHTGSLSCDGLLLESAANRVTVNGRPINLRGNEYRLLEFLMAHPNRTFNRTQLLTQVWGGDNEVDERTVDVNVQRLRKILSDCGYEAYVQTIRGFGYRFGAPTGA